MQYTGIELLQAIKNEKIKNNTKIKVLYLGIPTRNILEVAEDNLIWNPGEFYVGELWNDEYTFEPIEEINIYKCAVSTSNMRIENNELIVTLWMSNGIKIATKDIRYSDLQEIERPI